MQKRHRIFIAINLPPEIKKELGKYQKRIQELFTPHQTEGFGAGPVKWVRQDNLHITLVFLGYLTGIELAEVCNTVKEVATNHKFFEVSLNDISYGPKEKSIPRMIWVNGQKSKELSILKNELEKSLSENINFRPENRAFNSHITLARLKAFEWRAIEPEEKPEVRESINLTFTVESIEVMESALKRSGPEYTILQSFSLGT